MMNHKIDFVAIITADHCNPNGDPLNGNRPRDTFDGRGEMSDVCIKRKIRNRLQDMGERIFVQSDDKCDDGCKSLKERADSCAELKEENAKGKKADPDKYAQIACKTWFDVRAFGQVFAFKNEPVSCGVRGPVSIHPAFSVEPVEINSLQITKSVNSESGKDGKASDTMGMKHRVDFGVYLLKGSINCQLAKKTGFSDEDAEKIKQALLTLFENDASSARPEGSLDVAELYWFKHNSKIGQYSSAKVHRSIKIVKKDPDKTPTSISDYTISYEKLEGLEPEIYR